MAWDWPGAPCNFTIPHYTNDCQCGRYYAGNCESPPFYHFPGLDGSQVLSWGWLLTPQFLLAQQFKPHCEWLYLAVLLPDLPDRYIYFTIQPSIINPTTHADVVLRVVNDGGLFKMEWENRLSQRIALANLPLRSEEFQFFADGWTCIHCAAPYDSPPVGGCLIVPVADHCDYP